MNGHRIVLAVPIAAVVVALGVGGVSAKTFVGPITPHRHFVNTPAGGVQEVGPRVCDDPDLQHAFDRFHGNVHVGTAGQFAFKHEHNGVQISAILPCPPD